MIFQNTMLIFLSIVDSLIYLLLNLNDTVEEDRRNGLVTDSLTNFLP